MGDVKLACVMGLFLGRDVGVALLVGMLAGTIVGGLIMARKGVKEGRKTAVPFGPFLAFGSLVGAVRRRAHRRLVPRHLRVSRRGIGASRPRSDAQGADGCR